MWDALVGTTWGSWEAWRYVGLLALFGVVLWAGALAVGSRPAQVRFDPRFVVLLVLAIVDTGLLIIAALFWLFGALITRM